MKVHPAPKRSHYDINSTLPDTNRLINRQKKLRRLPHIFNKVLELPFHSETDVLIEETSNLLRFSVSTDDLSDDVSAHVIEIYPGVTKIVIRGGNVDELSLLDEFELWRFRLPQSTKPELASAIYINGELVVTVPKSSSLANQENGGNEEEGEVWGGEGEDLRGDLLILFYLMHSLCALKFQASLVGFRNAVCKFKGPSCV
ncbi:hypothetical protein MKW94_008770 [Papaver nudicaule]|uniref:SHSP domain-containing protein n=1 Tax=Papaver nudicaule TaxID=74823 RepID=A0AA41VH72_PAPNU|nr:hypothetical protein [Papaver nudicaule]